MDFLHKFSRILRELEVRQAIPPEYSEDLEERLVVACSPTKKPPSRRGRLLRSARSRESVRSEYQERKAQKAYQEVLRSNPHAFLPFILTAGPRFCESFDAYKFCKDHKTERKLNFGHEVKDFFEEIARKHKIRQSSHYLKVVETLFPQGPTYQTSTARISGQPVNSFLHFHIEDLLNFLKKPQAQQSQLQMICPFEGAPLPYIDLDLGSSPGLNGKIEFSYELSVAFIQYANTKGSGKEPQKES